MKNPKTCPNCKQLYKSAKDDIGTYAFGLEHQNPICPYRFSAFAHTEQQLQKNVRAILKDYKLIPAIDPSKEIKHLLRIAR